MELLQLLKNVIAYCNYIVVLPQSDFTSILYDNNGLE